MTYAELSLLLGQVSRVSGVVSEALSSGMLVARDSGQGSPCLDLARMHCEVRPSLISPQLSLSLLFSWPRR